MTTLCNIYMVQQQHIVVLHLATNQSDTNQQTGNYTANLTYIKLLLLIERDNSEIQ